MDAGKPFQSHEPHAPGNPGGRARACCCPCSWARSTTPSSQRPSHHRPRIHDVHNLPWLVTAYLIANTAIITALYGKISDIRGRRFTLMIALALYMLGSIVSALAPTCLC